MSEASATLGEKATVTIVDVLRLRAETQRDEIAYRFLADGEEERGSLTYGELYRRVRQIAAELQTISAVGQRALLLDSSELDFIIAFFGCLCAGVIAVPIYAPRINKKGNARVESVVADAQPSVILTAGAGSPAVRDVVAASAGEQVKWIDTNALPVDGDELLTPPAVSGTDIAFLQYTSGSTAAPKGVMVSHANILHNERMIQNAFDTKPGSVIVGWLPLYHDMGLIGNVLQPLYAGVPCILMSPVAFLQRPLRWLQAISRYQATTSGGPNFAYELCMRKIRPEDRNGLDLSSWRVAFNGAEPVRLETLNRFAAQFADCGFRREAFVPCYGLAEATLFVSGGLDPNGVTTVNHGANGNATNGGSGNGAKISRKRDKLLVACGRPPVEQAVRIVSPDSLRQCSTDEVGEIWISGPSVAQGYWRKAKETEETFKARIPEIDEGPFLRTGDLGFLKEGHLFITGRLKDLLIVRGQNYYPQDIELTVEQSHPILQPGSGAAFSVEIEGEERLVVVQEVAVRKDPESIVQSDLDELDALIKLISRSIVAGHELQAFAVVLIRKGTIPKTSSGKIQRHACRDAFLNRELYVLCEWHEKRQLEPILPKPTNAELDGHAPYGLASWLAQEIARIQGIDQERVDLNQPFTAYGLDSLAAIELAHKLQTEFQVEVDVAEFFGDSTITEVIRHATKNTRSPVRKVENGQPSTYPLSYGQRALWFMHRMAPESAAYNISRTFRIKSAVDAEALRDAFQALVDRHPCLRTIVVETAGEPVQQVAEKGEVSFEYFDARDWSQAELEKALVQQSQRPFSLTLGPLFRTVLYARSEKEYLLHVAVHHMVADYWTLTLLLDEIGKLYQAYANKVEIHLVRLEYSYADYVEWQREKLSGPAGERLRDYWKNELAGELPPLSLPVDHVRPPIQTFRGASLPFSLDAKLTERLKRLGDEQQATLFTTLLAAFQVLLHRLTSQKQVIVGCPIAGRSRAEFANIAGYFVNAAPLRADFQQRQTFTEFLSQVRNRVSEAFAHELYPFSLMVEQLGVARDPAVPPIFQSAFVFQQTYGSRSEDFVRFALGQPQAQVTLGGLQLEHVAVEQRTAQFDLTLTVGEGPDGLVGSWEYSSDLLEKTTIARWAESFSVLLEGIVSNPEISVSQLPILSASEYDRLVEELNRTKLEYDSDQCLHELIEEQAKTNPASAAIVCRETELSYTELNDRANQVARYLLRSGVRKEDLVGVCMRRSPEMVVAMLGIWKASAAYVPLDPQYPEERLRFMLEDADAKAVITEESLKERVGGTSATVLSWDGAREQIDKESSEKVGRPACSLQLAYLIYTSGSSGVPKGVMLTHRNAVSFVAWAKQAFTEEEFSGVLAATSICFDLSIFELWATLSCGGMVVLADDVIGWWESLQGGKITNRARLLNTVPSAVAQLIEQGPLPEGVVTINLAGEALKEKLVSELRQWGNLKCVNNLYGPTETTTYSSWATVEEEKKVTIGRGVGNTRLYVLDQELDLALSGVVGELYIAGAGVGRGYWGQASLTAERFLPDLYSKTVGDRMYRTGDLVRWNNAGQMEYLGRADQQVKVRGYRIELGEIEASVSRFPAVRENVVVVRKSGRDRSLIAYTAPRAGMEIKEEQLREYLRKRLPSYMLPSTFMILESLPKTPNGKVDRKALPKPRQREVKGRKPQNETEEMVAAIWAQVMQLDQVGVEENFFSLGGHSLLAMQVTSRIRQVFAVELQLRSFFETPTVAALALLVDKAAKAAIPPLLPLPRRQHLRLSFAQERLWFLSRYELETSLYNVPVAVRLRGALNVEAAKASLQEMVNRHEVLRTSFPEVGDSTIQDIAAEMEVPFAIAEIREDELDRVLREQARQSFDLSHGPLIRASLFRISSQDHVLLVVTHHIVSDGWSLGIMLREFNALYGAFSRGLASPLQPLPIQYADYSEWQREWLQGEVLERQLDYWREQLAGHETLSLPTDRPHSARPTLAGAMETSRLPEPLVSKLKLLSDQQGVTLFMTLLAGFEILLYRYTGQADISVGLGIANRNRQELEPLIGFFVNTLVLRTQFTEDSSVAELLQRVRDVSLQAYAHQDIPFERLVEALDPARELSRTPFFQALFVLQNAPLPTVSWDGLEATASILETGTAKFDLTLSAREEDGELELSLEYRTELFNAERMKRMLQHYRTLLEGIVASVETRISELELLSESERQQLLVEWNRTEALYSTNKCVHQLFEEQAAKTPQAVAVMDEDGQISYGELNRRANQLAHYLAKMGVGPEVRVGICVERGLEMMAGVLGVLKAGGAYVPLDPADPSARRSYMVEDAGAKFVLTNEGFTQQMAGCAEHVVDLEEAREEIEKHSGDNLKVHLDVENLAWVIYTSSSAGRPKGTAIPHRSAVSMLQRTLIDAMDQYLSIERLLTLYSSTEDTTYSTYAEVKHDEQGAVTIGQSQSNAQAYVLDGHMKLVPVGIKGELYVSGSGQARGYMNRPELTAEQFVPNPFSKDGGERLYRTGDLVRYQENGSLEFLGRLDSQVKIQGHRIEPGEIEAALLDYPGVTQVAVITREDEPGNLRLIGYVAGSERLDIERLRSHLQQRGPEYMVPAALLQLDTLPLTPNGKVDRKALIELESKEAMEEAGSLALTPTEELIAGVWSSLLEKSEIRRDDNFFNLGGHSLTVIQMAARLEQVFNREIDLRAMFEFPVLKDFSAYVDQLTGPAQLATLRPIVPTSRDGRLPLSLQQEQLWFLEQIAAGSTVYSLPAAVRLKGNLDKLALRLSLEEIVRRHEILRTSFVQVDGKPKQRFHETGDFELVERDLRETTNGVATEERISREQKEEAASPFLLSQPNLFRAKLLRVAEQEHILLLTFHHIVFDGWSIGVMVNELGQLYKAYHEGQSSPLPELPIQYADYTVWQREVMADGEFVDGLEYWKRELEGLSGLDLPSDHPRPAVQSFRGTVERWKMSPEVSAAIRKVSQEQGVTLFMTLLAGFQILLARYSGQRDIVVGSPIANRTQPELEALIGFFVNTLVLRGNVNSDLTVEAVLQRTREVCLGAYAHQSVPFEHLVDELQTERDSSRSPLFQVMFALQNAPAGALQMHGVEISMPPSATSGARFDLTPMVEDGPEHLQGTFALQNAPASAPQTHGVEISMSPSAASGARFDLTLTVDDNPEHLQGMMEYCTDLYERPTVRRMLDHYQQVLSEIARDPGQLISTLPLLSLAERQQLLAEWNQPYAKSQHKCLHELFEQQASLTPNALAVAHKGSSLTHTELNQRANQLGRHLKRLGVGSEELVGILLPRCSELLVAMLGVLKAGAAYVLLDPDDRDQLAYILKDARPDVIVSEQRLSNKLPAHSGRTVYLDAQWNESNQESEQNVEAHVHPENLAYVTYQSEGTKTPEGVAVQHGTVASLVCWAQSALSADDLQRVLTSNPPTSDLSILDTYVPLCCGGTVVVVDDSFDGVNLEEGSATLMNVTPSVMRELLGRKAVPASVRTIILAGEPVSSGLVRKLYDNCNVKRVLNLYGHSEISLGSTIAELQPGNEDKKVSIGRPVENVQAFVLDAHMELVPAGIVGELYLSAATSARGYFNRPDLTAKRLVPNIFGSGAERLFRTRELARHKANGELELWGRVDHETRIRGHRVELEEVEKALERQPEVADAVVIIPQTGAAENKLVAYIVPQKTGATAGDALERTLRVALKQRLPEYMVPSYWTTLERLPLLPDGKLDRSALPAVQPKMEEAGSLALTPTEELIAGVWSSLLGKSEIRRDDNFFDLGGHSLTVIQMLARLEQVFNREIELRAMFEFPVLKDFSAYIDQLTGPAQLATLRPIVPTSRDGRLPLSFAQQRLWFLAQMEGGSAAYHIPFGLHLKGDLNRTALGRALDRILVRHEVLRTTFAFHDGEPVQEIGAVEESGFRLIEHDLRGHNDVEAELAALSGLEAGASFDLEAGPLIRGRLTRLGEEEYVLLVTMHHIVSDGWSMGVLASELKALYGAFLGGEADPLPELEIQYADYAVWQRQWIEGEILQQQAAYWKITLAGAPALLELPMDRVRPVEQSYAGAVLPVVLEEKLASGLKGLSRRHGTTLYMTLLAGWAILLARLSGQQDVVVGSPVANRGRAEIENLIGFFVNTLALRLDLSGSPSVSELLQQTKAQSLAAQRHQDIPFEQVVELAQPVRSLAHSPLFQVMFAWQNAVESSLELPGLALLPLQSPHKVAQFDLTLSLREEEETIVGGIEYATSLFEPATIERYLRYFRTLLEAMVADDTRAVHRLSMLPESERHQLLYEWNDTKTEYPAGKCVHQLFEEQAAQRPEAVAVVHEREQLTYEKLNRRANQVAWRLRELGVGPEIRVAICAERSFELIIGMLGILKASGVYVPLDGSYPEERLKFMLADSAPVVLLTQGHLARLVSGISPTFPVLDLSDASAWTGWPDTNPQRTTTGVSSENLAYIIYTSGSTGQPNGVMIEHRSVSDHITVLQTQWQICTEDRILQFASPSFDVSVEEIFVALLSGATLVLRSDGWLAGAQTFRSLAERWGITVMDLPMQFWKQLAADRNVRIPPSVRLLIIGGEAVERQALEDWFEGDDVNERNSPRPVLWNAYGPTETTINATLQQINTNPSTWNSIGRPLANTRVYILDEQMQPVPVGVVGEMYVGGVGVARGYLKRPELTAERFVADPFVEESGARMYRTGDLGRWLADGTIEFVGRNDKQVKIRGFRIELGEIEARLAEHPEVREAVVLAREDTAGEKRLVAYYTCRESRGGVSESSVESVGAEQLRAHLSAVVPDYMVPAAYVRMERLPLTPSGKLDRKALPAPEQDAYAVRGYEAPVGEMETKLAEVWAEVLKLGKVGRHDNFFDLGGHSLLAVRVVSRLQQVLSVEVAVRDLFAHPELADLARHLQGAAHAELPRILPAKRSGDLPLSFAQQRLWFLAQMEGGSAAYHIPSGLHLKGDLNRTALGRALDRILVRHEVLRTTFAFHDGEPVQEIGAVEESGFRLIEHDLRGHNDVEAELAALSGLEAGASFDLEAGPLIRGRLIRLGEEEYVLLVTMHHIVSDGWSMGVLVSELKALYGAFLGGEADPLPELEIQYADYAVWQRQWIEGEILQQQAAYWKITLAGAPALLELPTDHTRPVQQDFAGGSVELVLDEQLTAGLKDLSRRHGTTLYMTLLAGWAILLARLSGQQDVVVGSPVANRGRAEIENLIGFFVNTLALRLDLSGSPSVSELLQQTKAQSLAAQRHQDIPFEQVVELAQPVRSLAHSPLFQVMFAWQNATEARLELPGLEVQPLPSASYRVAKFDLTLSLQEVGERIVGELEYATALYERSTLERYREYLLRLVGAMVADDTQLVACVALLPEGERDQILYEWNATKAEFPSGKCVHELFEEQVRRSPEARAVVFEEEELSYGELNARANRLAHYLRELGVKPDERVAICVERGFEMIVGLLAVLKAGGGYVPLDPAYPEERLQYMLEDSAPILLLTQEHLQGLFGGIRDTVRVLDLTDAASAWSSQPETNPDRNSVGLTSKHLAYVIYTSGSTGQPKGVMVEHMNVARLFTATAAWFQFSDKDIWSLFHSYAFDFSVWEIWGALLYGGRLVVVSRETARSPQAFYKLICQERVTILNQTPSAFRQLISAQAESGEAHQLRHVIFGGEALEVASLKPWYEQNNGGSARLINMYGITETTVHVTYRPLEQVDSERRGGDSPIGCRIPDLRIYILDSNRQPVPVGVSGEMYVGGAGVARGYLKRPELTAERFLADPFSPDSAARIYRTGDLGRWLADGNIEFVGRNDKQVKIRGFRIELGEIEARLAEHPEVREAVVLAREDTAGEKRLVAYYTCRESSGGVSESSVGAERLRLHLSAIVPDYMVPAAYVRMERLPLTPNGKLDRKALPAPEQDAYAVRGYEAPVGEMETKLAEVWAEVLKVERVGRHDNFFAMGGDSIRAIPVVSKASQIGLSITFDQLFRHQTVSTLAKAVSLSSVTHSTLSNPQKTTLLSEADYSLLPEGIEDAYRPTRLQMGMIYHNERSQQAGLYHDVFSHHLQIQHWDLSAFCRVLDALVVKHSILRTSFSLHQYSEPLQLVHKQAKIPVTFSDITDLEPSDQNRMIADWIEWEKGTSFDLSAPPLLRIFIHRKSVDTFQYTLSFHHAILDGWSVASFQTELFREYAVQSKASTSTPTLRPLASTFKDAVAREAEALQSEDSRNFWLSHLAGYSAFSLPPLEGNDKSSVRDVQRLIPTDLRDKLVGIATSLNVPFRTLVLAAHLRVVSLLAGRQDVVTGIVTHTRLEETEGEQVLGLFLNTLPFRQCVRSGTWNELIRATFETELTMMPRRSYPYSQMFIDNGRIPLFDTAFNYINFHVYDSLREIEAVKFLTATGFEATNFTLTLNVIKQAEALLLRLNFDPERFSVVQIERITEYYCAALRLIATDSNASHNSQAILPEEERDQVLYEWNETKAEFPSGKCVHELFELQAAKTPAAIAVKYEDQELTYAELNEHANQVANHLISLNVQPDTFIGLCLERGFGMVISMLGILKAGVAYLPIDPGYPEERLRQVVKAAGIEIVLTQAGPLQVLQTIPACTLIDMENDWPRIARHDTGNPSVLLTPANLAYGIFTSGSSGSPKAVAISHSALCNHMMWMSQSFELNKNDRILQKTPYTFDASVWEFYAPLLHGGMLVMARPRGHMETDYLVETVQKEEITILQVVPSVLELLNKEPGFAQCATLRILFSGGESLGEEVAADVANKFGFNLVNLYGPTEATIDATYWKVQPGASQKPAIGKPIFNTQVYVLDESMEPVPIGVGGELYIGGAGLAHGYLGWPELTADKFVPNPLSTDGGRLYRTGDQMRWRADGNLEFIGRIDNQVKLRGFRIELEEIEAVLERHPSVARCVVLAREDQPGEKRLVAYVVKRADAPWPKASGLEEHLKVSLPEYMVPTVFVELEKLPLTHNGKIDRKALPRPDGDTREEEYVGPRDPTEETLCRLWQEVLRRERVGIHDNFFSVGGHSLLAVQVISRIKLAFATEIPLSALFAGPTVARMAKHIAAANGHDEPRSSQILVSIQSQGSRAPLFCVHAVGGQVISYAQLSQELGIEQPFYGLQSPPANFFPESDISIEQMATLYNREIRSVQPVGPYLLSGWSMGGLVAWEMAQQLRREGETIGLLALMDTTPPSGYLEAGDRDDEISMLARFALDMSRLVGKDPRPLVEQFFRSDAQDQWNMVQETLTSYGVLAPKTAHAEMTALLDVYARNFRAMNNYSIQTSKQAAVYFRASETPERLSKPWTTWADGGIQFHSVPGDHFTILRRPNVRIIAEAMERYISANGSKESQAVSSKMSPRELIDIESQHTP